MEVEHSKTHAPKQALTTPWPTVNAIDRAMRKADVFLNLICVSLIMFLMFFAAGEIVGRYFFNSPIPGHVEIVELMMVGIVFLGLAYTQLKDGNIRMQILEKRFFSGRAFHLAEATILLLSLFVFAMITWASYETALEAYDYGDVTSYILWPTWPFRMCIPLGCFFLCLRLAMQLVQRITAAIIYKPAN